MKEVRIPTQKRSIEKRNRIIDKGFELMCKKGFYHTNTPEIAKYAKVSTGIIYQYFKDKKEIFLEGTKKYINDIMYPMMTILDEEKINSNQLDILFHKIIDKFIEKHTISKKEHEEIMAMSHLDKDISEIFHHNELEMTKKMVSVLEDNHIKIENALEKMHLVMNIIDDFCHEIIYHDHDNIDYKIMKEIIIITITNIIKNT